MIKMHPVKCEYSIDNDFKTYKKGISLFGQLRDTFLQINI